MGNTSEVAFVTGAGSGMGRAIAARLAKAGVAVAAADINEAAAEETATGLSQCMPVLADVTDSASVQNAFTSVESTLGPVSILVNCAGGDIIKPFVESTEEEWRFLVELNLMGVFRTTKAALPGMIERGSGRIVSIASDAGRVGSTGEAAYSGTKGGVISFMKTVAREVARHGITANSVCPGPTETPPLKQTIEDGGERLVEALKKAIPMRRLGQPEDVANAVAFLTSREAAFVTGQTLSVSGGLTMA